MGIHDNFFELGEHSLLGIQVTSRICQAFEVELPFRYLFEAPTIAELAEHIETLDWLKHKSLNTLNEGLEDIEL